MEHMMLLAFKHVSMSGRTVLHDNDLKAAMQLTCLPQYAEFVRESKIVDDIPEVETATHIDGVEDYFADKEAESVAWEARRAAGSTSPPPSPTLSRVDARSRVEADIAKDIAQELMEDIPVLEDGDERLKKFCWCSDAVQEAHHDMYLMWRANSLFREYSRDTDALKNATPAHRRWFARVQGAVAMLGAGSAPAKAVATPNSSSVETAGAGTAAE
jgi:hypothetical protein